MRKKGALTAAALGLSLLLVVAYYAYEIAQARSYTRQTLLPRIESSRYPLQAADLSPRQLEILLRVEDPSFFQHGGVDFRTPGQGLTTITQGLVKLLYFDKFRPGLAKVKQTLLAAFVLDPMVPKQTQLTLFLNMVPMGEGKNGFAEAAQHYFGKPFAELSQEQYMALVAAIIAPAVFNVGRFPQRNQERVARIQRLLNGEYQPKGLLDLFYGPLDAEAQKGLPPLSYWDRYYR